MLIDPSLVSLPPQVRKRESDSGSDSGCSHSPSRLALPKAQAVPQVEKPRFEAFPT